MHEEDQILIEKLRWLLKQQNQLIFIEDHKVNQIDYCKEFIIQKVKENFVLRYHFYREDYIDLPKLYLVCVEQTCEDVKEVLFFIQKNMSDSNTALADLFQKNYSKYMRQYRQQKLP